MVVWWWRSSKKRWAGSHDTLLFYTKSDKWVFNTDAVREPYKVEWTRGQRRADGSERTLKKGKVPDDVWRMHSLMPWAKERLKYPTQKPKALLKPIILASSNPNNIVLDPFCGCGTTLVVAHQLGRQWIGLDVSPIACNLMRDRLNKVGASDVRIIGAPKTIAELKALEPFQFQNWVIDRIGGVPSAKKSSDMGIDGYTFMAREPIQVKQSEGVGRNVVDTFETAIRREHKTSGYIVAFSFGKGAYEEAARVELGENLDIRLVTIAEMDKYL